MYLTAYLTKGKIHSSGAMKNPKFIWMYSKFSRVLPWQELFLPPLLSIIKSLGMNMKGKWEKMRPDLVSTNYFGSSGTSIRIQRGTLSAKFCCSHSGISKILKPRILNVGPSPLSFYFSAWRLDKQLTIQGKTLVPFFVPLLRSTHLSSFTPQCTH